jgi:hypothetical protein
MGDVWGDPEKPRAEKQAPEAKEAGFQAWGQKQRSHVRFSDFHKREKRKN